MTTLATTAVLTLAVSAQAARHPEHWVKGRGNQGWQWKWEVWLPDKWQRIARCETGLNFDHANGSYVSAFGIWRPIYNADARAMHSKPWNDRVHPSPWHQYRAALGHYKMHGGYSGWGCRAA
jgi:hypothetical protein